MSRLKTVVLPAPFGPISAWTVPSLTDEVDVLHGDEAAELHGEPAGAQDRLGSDHHAAVTLVMRRIAGTRGCWPGRVDDDRRGGHAAPALA